jgi:hypothetical protein
MNGVTSLTDLEEGTMFIMDGSCRIRKLFGPYTPKLYDGAFIELNEPFFESELKGGTVVGDTHFGSGRKLKNVKFHVPYSKTSKKYLKRVKYNADIREIRQIIETPFGELKIKFKALGQPFFEDSQQQGYIVKYVTGIHNFNLDIK